MDAILFSLMTVGCTLAGILGGYVYQKYLTKVLPFVAVICGIVGVTVVGIVLFGDTVQMEGLVSIQEITAEKVVSGTVGFLGLYFGFPKGQRWAKRVEARLEGKEYREDVVMI